MSNRPADGPPPQGMNLLMGSTTDEKVRNMMGSLEEDRIRLFKVWR